MPQLHLDKPGLVDAQPSSPSAANGGAAHPHAVHWALLTWVTLTVHALGLCIPWLDRSAGGRLVAALFATGQDTAFWLLFTYGPAVGLLVRDWKLSLGHGSAMMRGPRWAHRALTLAALSWCVLHAGQWAPWLLESAEPGVWETQCVSHLSSTLMGMPILAYSQALGLALFHCAVALSTVRQLWLAGVLERRSHAVAWGRAVWLSAFAMFTVKLVLLISYATG